VDIVHTEGPLPATTSHDEGLLCKLGRPRPASLLRPSFSRNATPHEQEPNVGFRQELTLNLRHRNDGFVPSEVDPFPFEIGTHPARLALTHKCLLEASRFELPQRDRRVASFLSI
jgi:hypothetical protein